MYSNDGCTHFITNESAYRGGGRVAYSMLHVQYYNRLPLLSPKQQRNVGYQKSTHTLQRTGLQCKSKK